MENAEIIRIRFELLKKAIKESNCSDENFEKYMEFSGVFSIVCLLRKMFNVSVVVFKNSKCSTMPDVLGCIYKDDEPIHFFNYL